MERLEMYEKQIEMLRIVDAKNKKQLFSYGKEVERLKAEMEKITDDLKEKDKEIQRSNFRMLEMRKFVKPKRVTEASLEESSYHKGRRIQTLQSEDSDHKSVSPSSKFYPPADIRYPVRKSYKPSYPKVEHRG